MNVNSRGHNLDTRFKQLFLKIKHPPGYGSRWVPSPITSLASLTNYTNICILSPWSINQSSGSPRLSTMSDRFRRMLGALQGTFCTSSSRGWNPQTGSRWQALAKEFMKSESTRALNIVSYTSRSSARGSTCFTPFRRNHEQRRRVISIWPGDG